MIFRPKTACKGTVRQSLAQCGKLRAQAVLDDRGTSKNDGNTPNMEVKV